MMKMWNVSLLACSLQDLSQEQLRTLILASGSTGVHHIGAGSVSVELAGICPTCMPPSVQAGTPKPFGVDDAPRIDAEMRRAWNLWHQRMHPGLSYEAALRDQCLRTVLRAHALANIRHGMDQTSVEPTQQDLFQAAV